METKLQTKTREPFTYTGISQSASRSESIILTGAIVIPARNEEATIGEVVSELLRTFNHIEVIVIDDGSCDRTYAMASLAGATVLKAPVPLGIGAATQLGIRYGIDQGHTWFARLDGDGQHSPQCLPDLLKYLRPGVLVQGSRKSCEFLSSSTYLRRMGSSYFQWLFKVSTGKTISDPTSGMFCFHLDIALKFANYMPSDFPEIECILLLLRGGVEVRPVEVSMKARRQGESVLSGFRALVYMVSVTIAFGISFMRVNPYRKEQIL